MPTIFSKTLDQLVDALSHLEWAGSPCDDVYVEQITFDSRMVAPNSLFVALRGEELDGHAFVGMAQAQGACAVLVEHMYASIIADGLDIPVIATHDTRAVLGELASVFYERPSEKLGVVGITGTNGKTTTTYFLESIFQQAQKPCAVLGTLNYRWAGNVIEAINTTPESLEIQRMMAQMLDDKVSELVMEVSSHGLSTYRLNGTEFDVAVFTNLSQDHLDFHGDIDAYRASKRSFFLEVLPAYASAERPGWAVINLDDSEGKALFNVLDDIDSVKVVTYSMHDENADVYGQILSESIDGSSLRVTTPEGEFTTIIGLIGTFNVSNALAATAAAMCRDVSPDDIGRGLAKLKGVSGRLERVWPESDNTDDEEGPAVFIDYAHTPDALERSLLALNALQGGKLRVVFGCGGNRDVDKRPVMGQIAAQHADVVYVTSDNPRREAPMGIIDDIVQGINLDAGRAEQVHPIEDRVHAIREAILQSGTDDVVLIAGKGHENYQEVADQRKPFNDREQALDALTRRSGRHA